MAGIAHWLVAQVPNKPGTHVLTFQFSVPYTQDISITPGTEVKMGEPRLTLLDFSRHDLDGRNAQGGGECVQFRDDQPFRP